MGRSFCALLGIAWISILADDVMSGRIGTRSGVPDGWLAWGSAMASTLAIIAAVSTREGEGGAGVRAPRALTCGLGVVGIVVFTAITTWPIAIRHDASWFFAAIAQPIAEACGGTFVRNGGLLVTSGYAGFLEFAASPENLRLPAFTAFVVGACVLDACRRRSWRAIAASILVVGVTIAGRFAVRVVALVEEVGPSNGAGEWWGLGIGDSVSTTLGMVVASLALIAIVERVEDPRRPGQARLAPAKLLALGGGATFVATFALAWMDPGVARTGKIVVDDTFSGAWEQSAKRLSETWFGDMSTYSLASAVEYLGWGWDVVVCEDEASLLGSINEASVVMVKTPHVDMPSRLIDRLLDFVAGGGGLLLVGDHTDLMGMNATLNALAMPAGITFQFDAVQDARSRGFNRYAANLGTVHPISVGVEHVEFMTSCSLALSSNAQPVMTVSRAVGQKGDYSNNSNFGALEMDGAADCGRLVVAASSTYGRGRVVAFTDSTILSSFAIFGDHRETVLDRTLAFLDRGNTLWKPVGWIVGRTALAVALICLVMAMRREPATAVAGIGVIWSGLASTGWILAGQLNGWALGDGPAASRAPRVGVLMAASEAAIPPALGGTGALDLDWAYDTAYCAIARTGLFPKLISLPTTDLEKWIWLLPGPEVTTTVSEAMADLLDNGANLLVILRNDHLHLEAVNELAATRGARIESVQSIDMSSGERGRAAIALRQAVEVTHSGFEVELLPFGGMLLLTKDCGRGRLSVLLGGEWLSRKRLGHCFAYPDRARESIYQSWFQVLARSGVVDRVDRRTYSIRGPTANLEGNAP